MSPTRPILVLFAVAALALTGCKGKCRQLSEKLCECAQTTSDRERCLREASEKDGSATVTAEDETRCEQLLPVCDCTQRETPEGKVNCGLARPESVLN
jgi:hypothetical protein